MFDTVHCVYCGGEIDGCCYPAYQDNKKIGYRHVACYTSQSINKTPIIADEDGSMDEGESYDP